MTDRMQEIEERLAYLERAIQDLDGVVAEMNRHLRQMRDEWRDLRTQVGPADPNRTPDDERPPHWGPPK